MPAFSYRQVKDLYDTLHDAGAITDSLPNWAQVMNTESDSDLYSAGLHDNVLKRASVGVDRFLEGIPGLVSGSREFGRSIGGIFGQEEVGAHIGESLPRMTANFLPLLIPGAGEVQAANLVRLGLTGLLSGADTYTQTDSPAAGLISGITAAALPAVANKAEQGALSFLRNRGLAKGVEESLLPRLEAGAIGRTFDETGLPTTVDNISRLFPRSIGQSAASNIAGQGAAFAAMEGAGMAQDYLAGNPVHNPLSGESLLGQAIGQIPFSFLHLGGKALGLGPKVEYVDAQGKTQTRVSGPMDNADLLRKAIDTTESRLRVKEALDAAQSKTPVEQIPAAKVTVPDPQTLSDIDNELAKIGIRKQQIGANPTPENVTELGRLNASQDALIQKDIEINGGQGIGTSARTPSQGTPVLGDVDTHYDKGNGYHVITVKEVPADGSLKYADGTPIQPGDRVGFNSSKFGEAPVVNSDKTENFILPPNNYLSKVVDKQAIDPKADTKQPVLPVQQTALDLEQHRVNVKALDAIEQQLAGIGSYGEAIDALAKVNSVRSQAGYSEIDLPSLIREGKRRKLKGDKESVIALLSETRRLQLAEELSKQNHMDQLQKEVDFEAQLRSRAMEGSNEEIILDIYNQDVGNASGRRGDIATTGGANQGSAFWQRAMALDAQGRLTPAAMRNWKENVAGTGAGLKKAISIPEETKGPLFEALSKEDAISYQLGAEAIIRVTSNAPNSDEAKLLKRWVINNAGGKPDFSKEAFEEAAVDAGIAEVGWDARIFAEHFIDSTMVKGWLKELKEGTRFLPQVSKEPIANRPIATERKLDREYAAITANDVDYEKLTSVKDQFSGLTPNELQQQAKVKFASLEDYRSAFAAWYKENRKKVDAVTSIVTDPVERRGEIFHYFNREVLGDTGFLPQVSKAPNLPAGGGFVWSLADYDPVANRLGGKHTLPKSGDISESQLKAIGGRGKPLNDVEIEMMKGIDATVGGGAFDGKGNVNVKKLDEVLKKNPVTVETHVYGQSGKTTPEKDAYDKLTHDWYDNLKGEEREVIQNYVFGAQDKWLKTRFDNLAKSYPQQLEKATEYRRLFTTISEQGPPSGPRATSYYKSISPFDTEKYPVVRVDVVLPGVKVKKGVDAKGFPTNEREGTTLWREDNLHENLPNTLGWAMIQFVPDPKTGETVMFVGEQQSRWGQQIKASEESRKAAVKAGIPITEDDGLARHPFLPFQHALVLKAAISEAQKRGVTKMIVSDGESAMMTEMHDKQTNRIRRFNDQGKHVVEVNGTWEYFDTKEEADKFASDSARPSQEGGMRLHYDTTLPSTMRKLTGDKGERVEMGVHKNAGTYGSENPASDRQRIQNAYDAGQITLDQYNSAISQIGTVSGSPVFRNPDGTPKSSITGLSFDISKAVSNRDIQGGFTLGDPSRAPRTDVKPIFVPEPEQQATHAILSGTGYDQVQHLLTSEVPEYKALAQDILKTFPEALQNIYGRVSEGNGTYTQVAADRLSSRITYDPSLLTMDPASRQQFMLHEVAHGLSMNLIEKGLTPELARKLEDIRRRAIDALPVKLKKEYERAIATDWFERSKTEDNSTELAPASEGFSPNDFQILYGLMDTNELVAQSWSSASMRDHLRTAKGQGNLLKKFVSWTRELFGMKPERESLLGELIDTTHQLMTQGEFLANAQAYGERWFEAQGKGGRYGQSQTQRGLGVISESPHGITRDELYGSLDGSTSVNPNLDRARRKVEQMFQEPDFPASMATDVLKEFGHPGNRRGLDDFLFTALTEDLDVRDALDLMPDPALKYIFEKVKDQKDVADMLASVTDRRNQKVVNIAKPELLRRAIRQANEGYDKFLQHQQKIEETAKEFAGLNAVDPMGFLDKWSAAPRVPEQKGDPIERSWVSRFLEPVGQWTRRFPEIAELTAMGYQLVTNARKMSNESTKVFGMDMSSPNLDVLSKDSVKAAEKVFGNPKLLDAANRWIHLNQVEGADKVVMLQSNHPKVTKLLAKLTPDERAQVQDMVIKQGKSTQIHNAQKIEKMTQVAGVYGAGILAENGLKTRDNVALATTTLQAVMDMADPTKQMTAQAQLQSVQARLQPDLFLDLLKWTQGEAEKIGTWKKYFDENPFWATAQRTERFLIRGFIGKKNVLLQASSMAEAQDIITKRGIKLKEPVIDQFKGREDEPFALPGISPEMANRLRELEENQITMLKKRGVLDDTSVDEFRRTSTVAQALREAASGSATSGLTPPPRLLSQGAEDLPWLWNHLSHIQRESSYWSRELLRAQAKVFVRDPEIAGNESLRKDLTQHFQNLLTPDPQVAQKMNRFVTTWFMGFNLAGTMVNATQAFTTHVAELTAMTGRPLESYRRITQALKEAGGHLTSKGEWATAEHKKFMDEAAQDGERGLSMWDDEAQDHESVATSLRRAMTKNKPQSLGQRLGTAAGIYSTAAMWPFRQVEQINATAALLAGFDLARSQGKSYEEAKASAYEFNHTVNFSGGRAQRPVGAYSGNGPFPRTLAMLGTSLQSYVLGTTSQIARYLQRGLFRPQGITPHEVYAARKAAVQMLGTQFFAAGLLGLPFASGAIALLDKLFPDLELSRKVREGVHNLLSSDDENGSSLTDVAMTGVPSMFGWDLQSRLSMGNTLPGVSEVNGFQAENLMGPTANIVKNFVSGTQGWVKGDAKAGMKMMPPSIRKVVEAANSALGDDPEGQARPTTRGEKLGQFLGFSPKSQSDSFAASRMLKQASEAVNRREGEDRQQLAEEILKGNFGTVRQSILSRAQSDKEYNPVDAIRSVARATEELQFPRDLRREGSQGTSAIRQSVLSSFGNIGVNGPSETERLQFRKSIETRLGLPQALDRGELALAQTMDQLRARQPGVSRAELRSQALQLLRRSRPSIESIVPE